MLVMCANSDIPGIKRRHKVYDFHWLRLGRFEKLQNINIWIAARSITYRDSDDTFFGIKGFSVDGLRAILTAFSHIKSVTLITPLGPSVAPQEGDVEGIAPLGVRLYKRGTGDRFHPYLTNPGRGFDGLIHTSLMRGVRLGGRGGHYDHMQEL